MYGILKKKYAKTKDKMKLAPLVLLLCCGLAHATQTYRVQPGDTLYRIARTAGVSVDDLIALNGLTTSTLGVGQTLTLPGSAPATPLSAAPSPSAGPSPLPSNRLERGIFLPDRLPAPSTFRAAGFGARPTSAYLSGVGYVHQTFNNCGPASISSALTLYGLNIPQNKYQAQLRPGGQYMSAGAGQKLLKKLGFDAPVNKGGTLADVKREVAAGNPVIVLQYAKQIGKVPHWRVVRGYDEAQGIIVMSDPLHGPNVALTERDFDLLWNTQGRLYIPVRRG